MSHADDVRLDETRHARLGFPKITYGEFRSADQIAPLFAANAASLQDLLIPRLDRPVHATSAARGAN
jgi:NCAIR mutase (PurE)-related protein